MHLGCSYEEACQVIEDDKIIDSKNGRCDWEPSIEEERAMRKATKLKVGRQEKGERKKVERKPDEVKENFIAALATYLEENYSNVAVTNAAREISFTIGEDSYSIQLIKHRNKS